MTKRLLIFGAGGMGREVAWLATEALGPDWGLVFVVDQPEFLGEPVNGIPKILLEDVTNDGDAAFTVALGDPTARRVATKKMLAAGLAPMSLIHPRVERSEWLEIGDGPVVCAGSILTTNITIGDYVQINLDCTIGHDVLIGDFVTLSPGAHVSGNVTIEPGAFIGTGATIINGVAGSPLVVGSESVVAAGACVTKSVEPGALVAGVPATRKK